MNKRTLLKSFAVLSLLAGTSAAMAQTAPPKRIMVYGDSNSWGWIPVEDGFPSTRYSEDKRWPGILRAELGNGFEVVDEALSGRTTDMDDPTVLNVGGAGLDGAEYLPAALASHLPLDLVIIMLGTNDLKAMYDRSPFGIALGAGELIDIVQSTEGGVGTEYPNPQVLLLAPPPLGKLSPEVFQEMFEGGVEKSQQLGATFEPIAKAAGAEFLDLSKVTATDGVDGIHFTEAAQRKIGMAVADKVKAIFN
jgi:lysophospholipase L1-like esterase